MDMNWLDHAKTTGSALKNWFVAQCLDSLAVAALWLIGLLVIGIPWAPLWALLAGALQFIPNFGGAIAMMPPAIIGALSEDRMKFFYVLILFAVITITDGFLLQPYFMKRKASVPFWASLLAPLVLALAIPFWWAVLLAPPILAVVYAFRRRKSPEGTPSSTS